MFLSTSCQGSFPTSFDFDVRCHLGFIWQHFSKKNRSEDTFEKRDPFTSKPVTIDMPRGSQRCRLACELLEQEKTVRVQHAVRICLHFAFQKYGWQWCLNWLRLRMFQKGVRSKCIASMSRAHGWWSDTPLANAWRTISKEWAKSACRNINMLWQTCSEDVILLRTDIIKNKSNIVYLSDLFAFI